MSKQASGDIEFVYEPPFPVPELLAKKLCVLPLSDGKRYLADGEANGTVVFVARVNSDGSADEGFGPGGWRAELLDSGGGSIAPAGLIPREEGGLIAAMVNDSVMGFVCFRADGTLDSGFGVNGKIVHAVRSTSSSSHGQRIESPDERHQEPQGSEGFGATAPGRNGQIYGLVGPRFGNGQSSTLFRCTSDGQLDSAFNGTGTVVLRHPDSAGLYPHGNALVATSDGGAVVAGMIDGELGGDMRTFFCRYGADGLLDENFGDRGFAVFDSVSAGLPEEELSQMELNHLAPLAGGGFAASGYLTARNPWRHWGLVICVDSTGRLVPSFNNGEPLLSALPGTGETSFLFGGIAQQLDGSLVVGGGVDDRSSGYQRDVLVVRFMADGRPDPAFGDGGWLRVRPYDHWVSFLSQVALDPEGKILVAGAGGPDDGMSSLRDFMLQVSQGESV